MITYNDLFEALRKERYSEELQALSKDFFEQVAEYFKDKKDFSEKQEDMFADLTIKNKKKLENAISIFKELLLRRRKKILNLAFVASETGIAKRDFDNLSGFEKELFDDVIQSLKKSEKALEELRKGKVVETKHRLVRFLDSVSEFMGMDGESVGPFEKGEIANLEKEIVDILIQDKKAEVIEE
jgi:DNA replication initiation complex subunit (GINS family)